MTYSHIDTTWGSGLSAHCFHHPYSVTTKRTPLGISPGLKTGQIVHQSPLKSLQTPSSKMKHSLTGLSTVFPNVHVLNLATSFSTQPQIHCWARPQPWAGNSVQFFRWGARDPVPRRHRMLLPRLQLSLCYRGVDMDQSNIYWVRRLPLPAVYKWITLSAQVHIMDIEEWL